MAKEVRLNIRISSEEKLKIQKRAAWEMFDTVSDYVRYLIRVDFKKNKHRT